MSSYPAFHPLRARARLFHETFLLFFMPSGVCIPCSSKYRMGLPTGKHRCTVKYSERAVIPYRDPKLNPLGVVLRTYSDQDPFYDRGSTFPLFFSERRDSLTPNRPNVNLDSEKKTFFGLGPWDHSPRCIFIFAEVSFRLRYGAP